MKKFFVLTYVVLVVALVVVTPFDLRISYLLYGELNEVYRIISDFVYVPTFFIGYFGVLYYFKRIKRGISNWLLKIGLIVGTFFGVMSLSYVFVRSMRFIPYYLYFSFLLILLMIVGAWLCSTYVIHKNILAFDYLLGVGLGMIGILYFMVTLLKMVFGRARFYLVIENEDLFSQWFEFRGMATHRDFYSIPSGHTTFVAIALWFIVVAFLVPQLKKYVQVIMFTVFIWVAFQSYIRILIGEHYLTDVLFSILLSVALMHLLLYVSIYIRGLIKIKFNI